MKAILLVVLLGGVLASQAGLTAAEPSRKVVLTKKPVATKKIATVEERRTERDGTIIVGKRELARDNDVARSLSRIPYIFIRRR